nr:hypothetical protein [Tanacetum cinerariifolium]
WLRNQPSGSITNWEVLKTKFLNKYCPPARTAKKIKEINNFQQKPNESLFYTWERFKELDSKGAIPSKTVADAKIAIQKWLNSLRNGTMKQLQGLEVLKLLTGLLLSKPNLTISDEK